MDGLYNDNLLKIQMLTHGRRQPLTSPLISQQMLLCGLSERTFKGKKKQRTTCHVNFREQNDPLLSDYEVAS